MIRRSGPAAALLAVAAVVGACSSSTPAATTSTSTPTTVRPTSSTAGVNPAPPTSAGATGSGAPFAATGDFCADLKVLQAAPAASSTSDPAAGFRALDDLKSEAPAELRDVFDLLTTAIARLGTTDATDPAAVQEAYAALSDPKFAAGFQRLADYARTTCHVDLTAATGTAS